MLSEEQSKEIKKQLIEQVKNSLPEEEKQETIEKILEMNSGDLEVFLKKNDLKKEENPCIFCSLVSGNIPSYKIDENDKAIAVLEINPISRGHALVIPKKHVKDSSQIPNQAHTLAKKISKKIKSKLKPKKVKIFFSNLTNHEIINILPLYGGEKENSQGRKASEQELNELSAVLKKEKSPEIKKIQKKGKIERPSGKIWLPKRIP